MPKSHHEAKRGLFPDIVRVESFMMHLPPERDKRLDSVWRNFSELTAIPRASGNESKVSALVEKKGKKFQEEGLVTEVGRDEANNIIWTIPATEAKYDTFEAATLLQGHLDMVCQTSDPSVDPALHGVNPEVIKGNDGDWYVQSKDKKTTLGADNGVMASFLMSLPELLHKQKIPHGPLKVIFTTGEESGLAGAHALDPNTLRGYKQLINIDIEDENEITIGSAAIGNTRVDLRITREPTATAGLVYRTITVAELEGGHSGMTIGDGNRENAIKLASEVLNQIPSAQLVTIDADARLLNAIQKDTSVTVGIKPQDAERLDMAAQQVFNRIKGHEKASARITVAQASTPDQVLTRKSSQQVLNMLTDLPHGVLKFDPSDPHTVQTSTNMATAVLTPDADMLVVQFMSRSSFNAGLSGMRGQIEQTALLHGATSVQEESSPAWEPVRNSSLSRVFLQNYTRLYHDRMPPHETITHGGLETALFVVKAPDLLGNMIAIGPDLFDAHSVNERVRGPSTEREIKLVLETLRTLAKESLPKKTTSRRTQRTDDVQENQPE